MAQNPFDQAARYLAKRDPIGFFLWLLADSADIPFFRGWLDTRSIPFPGEPDRTNDTVAEFEEPEAQGRRWAVVIEFQTKPRAQLFARLLEYLARLWLELRPAETTQKRYEVAAAVVYLTGSGRVSKEMSLAGIGAKLCLKAIERNVAREDAAETLVGIGSGRIARSLLALVPLMRGGGKEDIIARWKQLALAETDEARRADHGGLALVFAQLAKVRAQWKLALEGWNVMQSEQVLEWQAEAEKRGMERGMERGEAKGLAEAILKLLASRFSQAVPLELAARIRETSDLSVLDRWFTLAMQAPTIAAFRKGLNGQKAGKDSNGREA